MPPIPQLTSQDTRTALELLTEAQLHREEELKKFNSDADVSDSDEENDSSSPVYDSFYRDGGSSTIIRMTNFSAQGFSQLWVSVEKLIRHQWNTGRGSRYRQTPKDVLFMTLTVFKHGGQWDFLGRMFHIKGPTFERMITRFVLMISEPVFQAYVFQMDSKCSFKKLMQSESTFNNFKCAGYAVDVFFHQSNRPSGTMEEGRVYYSGKHKLYGYKTEVSVLPNGMAIGVTDHHPGSRADVDIFYWNHEFHETALEKQDDEKAIPDIGELSSRYPNMWAVLADKGYQGGEQQVRLLHPTRKPPRGLLTIEQTTRNKLLSSDRIVVENWFGRFTSLWTLFSSKWRWSEKLYDRFFEFAAALTNLHIKWHPLRAADGDHYQRVKNRIRHIGEQISLKRRMTQKRYRERKKMRLDMDFGAAASDDATVDPALTLFD